MGAISNIHELKWLEHSLIPFAAVKANSDFFDTIFF